MSLASGMVRSKVEIYLVNVYTIYIYIYIYVSQKQLPRKMKSRLVIIQCAGNIFWQLFLRRLILIILHNNL